LIGLRGIDCFWCCFLAVFGSSEVKNAPRGALVLVIGRLDGTLEFTGQ